MKPIAVIRPYLDDPLFARPHRRSVVVSTRLIAGLAGVAALIGMAAAVATSAGHRDLRSGAMVLGALIILFVVPIAGNFATFVRLRSEFRRMAEFGDLEQLRTIPDLPRPLLPYFAIAVYLPMARVLALGPVTTAGSLFLGNVFGHLMLGGLHDVPNPAYSLIGAALGIFAARLLQLPVLMLAGPLGHAVQFQVVAQCVPSIWEESLDDEWERDIGDARERGRLLIPAERTFVFLYPFIVLIMLAAWLAVGLIARRSSGLTIQSLIGAVAGAVVLRAAYRAWMRWRTLRGSS